TAADPVCAALVAIGECASAREYWLARRRSGPVRRAYSARLARRIARAFVADAGAWHAVLALAPHARLVVAPPRRARGHHSGAFLRNLVVLLRRVETGARFNALAFREISALGGELTVALERDRARREHAMLDVLARAILNDPAEIPVAHRSAPRDEE